jgi:hypothetical protein
VNTRQKQDTHGKRLADDRYTIGKKRQSDLDWCFGARPETLFRSFIVVCMLLTIFLTTTVNTKQKQDTHGMRLAENRQETKKNKKKPPRKSDQVRCFGARLENYISVVYCCLHASKNILDDHREHQAKTRHAWHSARRRPPTTRSDASVLDWRVLFGFFWKCRFLFRSFIFVSMLLKIF